MKRKLLITELAKNCQQTAQTVAHATVFWARSVSEAHYKTEQVLKVFQSSWRRRRQLLTDFVVSDEFAEAVAKIEGAREAEIDSHVGSKDRAC